MLYLEVCSMSFHWKKTDIQHRIIKNKDKSEKRHKYNTASDGSAVTAMTTTVNQN